MLTIGAVKLKAAREKRGLTQAEAALLVGAEQQAISRIEAGRAVPTLAEALAIAAVFKVPASAFGRESKQPVPPKRKRRTPAELARAA